MCCGITTTIFSEFGAFEVVNERLVAFVLEVALLFRSPGMILLRVKGLVAQPGAMGSGRSRWGKNGLGAAPRAQSAVRPFLLCRSPAPIARLVPRVA